LGFCPWASAHLLDLEGNPAPNDGMLSLRGDRSIWCGTSAALQPAPLVRKMGSFGMAKVRKCFCDKKIEICKKMGFCEQTRAHFTGLKHRGGFLLARDYAD